MKILKYINPIYWILKRRKKKNEYEQALQKIGYIIVRRMDNDRAFRRVLDRNNLLNVIDQIMHETVHKTK